MGPSVRQRHVCRDEDGACPVTRAETVIVSAAAVAAGTVWVVHRIAPIAVEWAQRQVRR